MRKALIGAVVGLIVGAGFAVLLALMIHLNRPSSDPSYRPSQVPFSRTQYDYRVYLEISDPAWPNEQVDKQERGRDLWADIYFGILVGGGFGAIVGVVTGSTTAIVRAVRESRL